MKRLFTALALSLSGCGSPSVVEMLDMTPAPIACTSNNDCAAAPARPQCSRVSGKCSPRGYPIGSGDGSATSVTIAVAFDEASMRHPTGLGWNPLRPAEMWVVDQSDDTVYVVTGAGTSNQAAHRYLDPDAIHFMNQPTGIAFGEQGYFGTCGENDGTQDDNPDFTGPTLFSSDPKIFAKPTKGGLGSHIDMLHDTNFCMGIAHEKDNVFWVFDGGKGSLARYDFQKPHAPGADDHSDGEIGQYVMGKLKRADGVPSGVAWNPVDQRVYVADTGNQRVVAVDPATAKVGRKLPALEPTIPVRMEGATLSEIVPKGTITTPSGLVLDDGLLYVADNATSRIHAIDLSGTEVRFLDTGRPAGSIGGLAFDPDGKLYFVDMTAARIYRIDPL